MSKKNPSLKLIRSQCEISEGKQYANEKKSTIAIQLPIDTHGSDILEHIVTMLIRNAKKLREQKNRVKKSEPLDGRHFTQENSGTL
jgi:hypothetical protein